MGRARDLGYETLAEVTATDQNEGRGKLNAALASIRRQSPGLEPELEASTIRQRAVQYRRMWPTMTLTPNALAAHWLRIDEEAKRLGAVAKTNQWAQSGCAICGDDHWVDNADGTVSPCPQCGPRISR